MPSILTLNINGPGMDHGPWEMRKRLIRQAIKELRPDICALQAVEVGDRFQGGNQAAQLASTLPAYPYLVCRPPEAVSEPPILAVAFLSRWPASEVKTLQLTRRGRLEDHFNRVLLHGRFELPDGTLQLVNAHFSWVEDQAMDNVHEALSYIQAITGVKVLVGDMNQTADSRPIHCLAADGWTDVWPRLHPDDSGFTFPSHRPEKRIDYAWVSEGLMPRVQGIALVTDGFGKSVRMSDHLGLLLTLSGT